MTKIRALTLTCGLSGHWPDCLMPPTFILPKPNRSSSTSLIQLTISKQQSPAFKIFLGPKQMKNPKTYL